MSCVTALRMHRSAQNAHRLPGRIWRDIGFAFTNELGEPVHPSALHTRFRAIIAASGMRVIRFHDLCHTRATLLLVEGMHPRAVQERLGHAGAEIILNRYSHVTPTMQRQAADALLSRSIAPTG